jgi:hypothetical protein
LKVAAKCRLYFIGRCGQGVAPGDQFAMLRHVCDGIDPLSSDASPRKEFDDLCPAGEALAEGLLLGRWFATSYEPAIEHKVPQSDAAPSLEQAAVTRQLRLLPGRALGGLGS